MFLNNNNLVSDVVDVWTKNYIGWKKSIIENKSMKTIHHYRGGMTTAEVILNKIIGPNLSGDILSSKRQFIDKHINELTID